MPRSTGRPHRHSDDFSHFPHAHSPPNSSLLHSHGIMRTPSHTNFQSQPVSASPSMQLLTQSHALAPSITKPSDQLSDAGSETLSLETPLRASQQGVSAVLQERLQKVRVVEARLGSSNSVQREMSRKVTSPHRARCSRGFAWWSEL